MKLISLTLISIAIASLTSCGGSEQSVEVSTSTAVRWTVPSKGFSCYANKTAQETNSTATSDVDEAYFSISKLNITSADSSRDTVISLVNVIYTPPNGSEIVCDFGAEELAALNSTWWADANKEARIPAGSTSWSTDCPIRCGGISINIKSFTASGVIKVYGYTVDPNDEDDQQGFSTTTYFTYGSQY
ncbi:hypothetical protein [Bdellovibrio sp. HCB288]|uniref:hypothetical protein n=1 Tax=Bdellovibrio sp. HCB288 TaxID=3394355 RepID=UPI0039B57A4D